MLAEGSSSFVLNYSRIVEWRKLIDYISHVLKSAFQTLFEMSWGLQLIKKLNVVSAEDRRCFIV